MSIDNFIPGIWFEEKIDVNDFVSLNKRPADEAPTNYLITDENLEYLEKMSNILEGNYENIRVEERLLSFNYLIMELNKLSFKENKFNFTFSEPKGFAEMFAEAMSSDLKKGIKMGLLEEKFGQSIPPIFIPDIRQLPLYGVKRLIDSKKDYLKKSERYLQNSDWIDKRIEIHKQIEALEKFNSLYPIELKKQARSTIEMLNGMLAAILYSIQENPFLTFHLPALLNFIDIYIEMDIRDKRMNEEDAQKLIVEFYSKLLLIQNHFKKIGIKFIVMETIYTQEPSKTTFRFLTMYKTFKRKFPLMIVSHSKINKNLENLLDELIQMKAPMRFIHTRNFKERQDFAISHLGFSYRADQDVILFNKPCDTNKLLSITLNGGKDVVTNSNLYALKKGIRDDITFDELWEELEKTVSYVFTMYSEANNITMYLTEKYFFHPYRNSFKNNQWIYKYYFSFTQIDAVAEILAALKYGKIEFKRNEKKQIINVEILQKANEDQVSNILNDLVILLHEQIGRVPFYQNGKARIHCFLNTPIVDEEYRYSLTGPEFIPVHFILNNRYRFNAYQEIIEMSAKDILDIQI